MSFKKGQITIFILVGIVLLVYSHISGLHFCFFINNRKTPVFGDVDV